MPPLRVALDATPRLTGRTGAALYVEQLELALQAAGVTTSTFAVGRAAVPPPPGCRHLRVPTRIIHPLWARGLPPRAEHLAPGVDLVHATSLLVPPTRRPLVIHVHDLAAAEHPDLHPPRIRAQTRTLVRQLHRASAVTALTAATGRAVAALGFPSDRIVVTHSGLVGLPEPGGPPPVRGPYLLAVGEVHPRKGLDVLLRAMADADLDEEVSLVHAGPPGAAMEGLLALAAELGLADRVRFLGYVEREVLAALVAGALALCFPSWSEGLGLPVLEAMAMGTPAVASDIDAVREVCGDNALLVPPGDVAAWAAAIGRIVGDDALRGRLRVGGERQAGLFTWERCAETTLQAYALALEG